MKYRVFIIYFLVTLLFTHVYAGGKVNEFTLSNGLKIIHKEIGENPLITIQLFVNSGSLYEQKDKAGLANFVQVLLLKGTKKRDAKTLAIDIEDIGASISSDAEHDYCSLGISVVDLHFQKALEILSDVAVNPSFNKEEIEKERFNLIAGIKSREDRIFNVAFDLFNSTFYRDHPYSWPDIGKIETVSNISRKDMLKWHKEYYKASNMLLVITGNIKLRDAEKYAIKYFSKIPKSKVKKIIPKMTKPTQQIISKKSKKFQQAYIMIGYPVPKLTNADYAALKVTNAILGGRMSSRLFVELREKLSLAYEVNSFYPSRKQLSRFVVYMGLDIKNLKLAKKRIKELIADLKSTPVKTKELNDTKNYIKGVFLLDHQTVSRQAWYLGWWESMGKGYKYDEQYLNDLLAVTSEQIQEVAQKYFTDQFVQIEIVPEKED